MYRGTKFSIVDLARSTKFSNTGQAGEGGGGEGGWPGGGGAMGNGAVHQLAIYQDLIIKSAKNLPET